MSEHRKMIAPDIGCLNWQTDGGRGGLLRINFAKIPRPWPTKPSLWHRIKGWFS